LFLGYRLIASFLRTHDFDIITLQFASFIIGIFRIMLGTKAYAHFQRMPGQNHSDATQEGNNAVT
jgi:hypothetical protein